MPNAIPLLEGTDASGGFLVPDVVGETLQNRISRESAVARLARNVRLTGKRQTYPVYAGRPTASFVGEGAAKPVTGAEFASLALNVKKIATHVIYTEELLEDAREDPRALIGADVEGAFVDLIDAHALGYQAGAAIVGNFDSELTSSTATVELGTTADAFAVAVSSALGTLESNGYLANGIVAATDVRGHLRDSRQAGEATAPVYTDGYTREPDSLYGLPISYSSNLDAFPAAVGKVAAVVGDFNNAILGIRKDLQVRFSDQATIGAHNLFEQNKVAAQFEMRVGFVAHEPNRAFVVITNAA